MSFEAIAYAKQLDLGGAESAAVRLLVYVIAENTFNDTFVCKVCQDQLAYEAGRMSERSVRRHLKDLEDARIIVRRTVRGSGGHVARDDIRLVGFKRWYWRDHAKKHRRYRAVQAANLAGSEGGEPSGQIGRQLPDSTCPPATGQQVSGRYKEDRTSTSRTSPPQVPQSSTTPSTSGPHVGGGGKDWKSGWARGWTLEARDAVDELRFATDERRADVADVFIAAVRGTRSPPAHADAAAYVRELGAKLAVFDRATLERLAQHQIDTRSTQLDTVPNIAAAAKAPSIGKGATSAEIVGIEIQAGSDEWHAWARHFRDTRRGNMAATMAGCKSWLVPSRWPPKVARAATAGAEGRSA